MKKEIVLVFIILSGLLFSCSNKSENKSVNGNNETKQYLIKHYQTLFDRGIKYKDPYTALSAAQAICALDSALAQKMYNDTLAKLYAAVNMGNPASKMADEVLKTRPDDVKMLDIKQTHAISSGEIEEAKELNRKLYSLTKKSKYLFHIAFVEIETKNFQEGLKVLDEIKSSPSFAKDSVEFQYGREGLMQNVPIQAADIYLRAYVDIQGGKYQPALIKFQEALKIYPKFYKAQENYQMLLQGLQQQQGR